MRAGWGRGAAEGRNKPRGAGVWLRCFIAPVVQGSTSQMLGWAIISEEPRQEHQGSGWASHRAGPPTASFQASLLPPRDIPVGLAASITRQSRKQPRGSTKEAGSLPGSASSSAELPAGPVAEPCHSARLQETRGSTSHTSPLHPAAALIRTRGASRNRNNEGN